MALLCQQLLWDMKYTVFCLPNAENMEWEGAVARREVLPYLPKASPGAGEVGSSQLDVAESEKACY